MVNRQIFRPTVIFGHFGQLYHTFCQELKTNRWAEEKDTRDHTMITGEIRILEVSDDRLRARADGSAMFGQRNIIQKRLVFLPDEYIYIYIYIYEVGSSYTWCNSK